MPGDPTARSAPLVLLPGTLCDDALFEPLLEQLPLRRSQTLPLAGGRDAAAVADRILAHAPPRFALLGFSLGGMIALEIAARAPDRLLGLALVGSNARAIPPEERQQRRDAWTLDGDLATHVRTTFWPNYVAPSRHEDAALRERIVAMALRIGADRLHDQIELVANRADSRARLAAIDVPGLVLAGTEDALCPPPMQAEMAAEMPDATLALVANAGHFVLMEAPDEAARHIAAWLARVDAATGHAPPCYTNLSHSEAS